MNINQYVAHKQTEMTSNNQMFNMMQDSMLRNHATLLNIANNIGGSDDYYHVNHNQ